MKPRPLRVQTPRLVLFVPDRRDAARMLAYAVRNREHLEPWEPLREPAYYTLAFWRGEMDGAAREFEARFSIRLILAQAGDEEGAVVGTANFRNVTGGVFQSCTLGYGVDRDRQGQGLMEEALRSALQYAFGSWNLHRVTAAYMPRNGRSGRLLEKLGFEREGIARDYLRIAGRWEDHVLTSKINGAWRDAG